ncbi:MAG: glycosyltransferase family 4 protein, partial [Myxococcales bacterium]|nr:glycosyltransferase family 4 protein [Myxococcales bacterium]
MPRLLLLTSSFPRSADDHRGGFVYEWCRELGRRGWPSTIVAPDLPTGAFAEPGFGCTLAPLRYWTPRSSQTLFHRDGVLTNIARDPRVALQSFGFGLVVGAYLRTPPPAAIVVSHWLVPMGIVGAEICRRYGTPHLAICHSSDLALLERLPAGGAIARHLARYSRRIVFVSSSHEARFRRLHGLPTLTTAVQPMGVPWLQEIPETPHGTASPSRGLRVGFLGRLVPLKGVDQLLEAAAGLTGVELRIGGEGPERRGLEALARARSVSVRFEGTIPASRRWEWLQELDALVVPSVRGPLGLVEGAPRVVLEAMSAGVPLIASSVGGIPEIAAGAALLVPP